MKILVIAILLLTTSSFILRPTCEKLKNGNYQVELDSIFKRNYGNYEFKLKNTSCSIIRKASVENFKISWLSNCSFRLSDKKDSKTSLTDFHKLLVGFGDPYFDIVKVEKDTSYFIYRVNLHVQIYSGRFIRIKK